MGTPPEFKFTMTGRHKNSLARQITEALQIENETCDNLVNGKEEWGRNMIPRLINIPDEEFKQSKTQMPGSNMREGKKRFNPGFKKSLDETTH